MSDASFFPKRSDSQTRRLRAEVLYDLEVELREIGWGDPALVHDRWSSRR